MIPDHLLRSVGESAARPVCRSYLTIDQIYIKDVVGQRVIVNHA